MRPAPPLAAALVAATFLACSDAAPTGGGADLVALDTTRLCALVPARDVAAAAFPPAPPVRAFGTDLGFTYERDGIITILFGDTWQRIDVCPIYPNDDSLATLAFPAGDWPGYTASASIPDAQCPELTFALDEAGTSFAPIVLTRWDGVAVPLGPLNTPVAAFHDGEREWSVFLVAGGQRCTAQQAAEGATCPSELSPQAADLSCGTVGGQPLCRDPGSTKSGDSAQAYYLHVAERVGPAEYVSRAMFLTNRYLNLTARAVRGFDPGDAAGRDYAPGAGSLLMWGRPGFDDQAREGEAPPYFMYHPLPFVVSGDRIDFRPRYFRGLAGGEPQFSSSQADALPLYGGEFEPVNQAAVSWIEPLESWLMIYGGNNTDLANDGTAGRTQPVRGAMYARVAPEPWGPWGEPQPVLTNEQAAEDIVCGIQAPVGCLPPPDALIRPACIEAVDPLGGGHLYGANIIDSFTRARDATSGRGRAADVFWNVSTWHPYSVVLIRTRVEVE